MPGLRLSWGSPGAIPEHHFPAIRSNRLKDYRVNQKILDFLGNVPVRCVDEEGKQIGVFPAGEAMDMAAGRDLDLVLLAPDSAPPVCRFCDYSKFRYTLQKNAQQVRKHQRHIQVKEVKLRPSTGESDYKVKLNNVLRFLKSKNKVRIVMRFRGREIVHRHLGLDYLKRMQDDTASVGVLEKEPTVEGRTLTMLLSPR